MAEPADDREGPRHDAGGVNFHLSRKEPARELMWVAFSLGIALVLAWFGGKLDGVYLLTFLAMFGGLYVATWLDESKADEDRSIKLRIGPAGIEIPEKLRSVIAWSDIEAISTSSHKGETTLHIVPAAETAGRIPVNEGWRKWLTGKGIDYQLSPLEGDAGDVIAAIRRYGPRHLTQDL